MEGGIYYKYGLSLIWMLILRKFSRPSFFTGKPRQYHKKVVDHYENPRNVGSMDKSNKSVGVGLVGAPACGDVMMLSLKISEKAEGVSVVKDAKFKTFGCGSAIASSSYVTEYLIGKTVEQASKINNAEISKHLKLPPVKLHCSMLAEQSVKAALSDYERKKKVSASIGGCGNEVVNKNRDLS